MQAVSTRFANFISQSGALLAGIDIQQLANHRLI